ncbi:MAG: YggS family pyridoxal phosphate-dependent enzyme [Flavobacteriales bacterium]|mgnify:FL=1|nr:YggS family pyridoxal phosphate-dependent enzyme [Flavobacteriales bacterium]
MSIEENISAVKNALGGMATLVAVSKTKPAEDILQAYRAGQRIFGENKVQEMCAKYEALPKDIEWHMIGHLQSNKVKYIAPFVSMIQSVDSFSLLRKIDAAAQKAGRTIDCLLEVKIAAEDTKYGLTPVEAEEIISSGVAEGMQGVRLCGLMGMASNTDDVHQVRTEFSRLRKLFDTLREIHPGLDVLSMGMSGDYLAAVECGSNMVRVGSGIFGARNYPL